MKRIITVALVVLSLCIFLSSCYGADIRDYIPGNWIPHAGERPSDQVPSRWEAEEINCWFEVSALTANDDTTIQMLGEIEYDSAVMAISVRFDPGRTMFVYDASGEMGLLFRGPCNFDEDKFVIEVEKKLDNLFDGQLEKITFYRASEGTALS